MVVIIVAREFAVSALRSLAASQNLVLAAGQLRQDQDHQHRSWRSRCSSFPISSATFSHLAPDRRSGSRWSVTDLLRSRVLLRCFGRQACITARRDLAPSASCPASNRVRSELPMIEQLLHRVALFARRRYRPCVRWSSVILLLGSRCWLRCGSRMKFDTEILNLLPAGRSGRRAAFRETLEQFGSLDVLLIVRAAFRRTSSTVDPYFELRRSSSDARLSRRWTRVRVRRLPDRHP